MKNALPFQNKDICSFAYVVILTKLPFYSLYENARAHEHQGGLEPLGCIHLLLGKCGVKY
jgi:hypothetical protein